MIIALIGFGAMQNLLAQSKYVEGIRGGYTSARQEIKLNSFEGTDVSAGSGFYVGFYAERRFAERFSFHLDLDYLNVTSEIANSENVKMRLNNGLLIVPLSLKVFPTYDLGIYLGGYLGTSLHNKIALSSTNLTSTQLLDLQKKIEKEIKDDKLGSVYGLRFGADYRVWEDLHLEMFYYMGFPKKGKNKTTQYNANLITAGLNYRF
ncbi:MAG: outer membrane beta-barrel protein [Bacteroidota bacterium]|nr:outer membrane beta-barrel protein [Bacteroidota bacterium]